MVNKKLRSVGEKLNVSEKDIKNIKNNSIKEKLSRFFIHPVLRVILAIITFIIGVSLGGGCVNCAGYPYSKAAVAAIVLQKRKRAIIPSILIPIATFIAGYLVGVRFFGYAILYNVYKR
jgi:hypothetical protein